MEQRRRGDVGQRVLPEPTTAVEVLLLLLGQELGRRTARHCAMPLGKGGEREKEQRLDQVVASSGNNS